MALETGARMGSLLIRLVATEARRRGLLELVRLVARAALLVRLYGSRRDERALLLMATTTATQRRPGVMWIMTGRAQMVRDRALRAHGRRLIAVATIAKLNLGFALVRLVARGAFRVTMPALSLVAVRTNARRLCLGMPLVAAETVRVPGVGPRRYNFALRLVTARTRCARHLENVGLVAAGTILVTSRQHRRARRGHLLLMTPGTKCRCLRTRPVYLMAGGTPRVSFDCELLLLRGNTLVAPLTIHPAPARAFIGHMRVMTEATGIDITVR